MKKRKELERRFGKLAASLPPYPEHLDLRPFADLDDDGLAFLLQRVRGVQQLDLLEAAISNQSIRLLSTLDYVQELRLKDCYGVDDQCACDLGRIRKIQLLHLRFTSITLEGLLKTEAVPGLEELHFSAPDGAMTPEKIQALRQLFPACKFFVNGRPFPLPLS